MMFLAQAQSAGNGGILAPFVIIFGWIIKAIYSGLAAMGIYNVGLCIILFTLVSKLILLPLTMKQQRSMKINQVAQPEINKITKKYRNKRDQASMMKQNEEMQKVYEKYGTSPTGGCATTLIQFPIIMALYYVIRGVEIYIPQIAQDAQFHPNSFFGMDLNSAPGFRLTPLMIIPVLSFIFQFLSAKTSMASTQTDENAPGAGMTKSMMYTMPLMSFVMCITLPIGIGIYWTASALFQYIQQIAFNYYYDHTNMDKIIEKSREKAAKKKKKKGPSLYEKMLGTQATTQPEDSNIKKVAGTKSTKNVTYSGNSKGGIASKANAMNKNKGGK
ncbi:MAG: YidC/Oxa1 family membrane protein insertase [Anaerostipes sp.]|uniref:YidC/Oxa1 family membrane protein insertase n=1 Tax=Anaerostipes sp. TaxID=1872530 RepID=UPI003991668B